MPQHDYDLANQSGAAFRADLNAVLQAIVTKNSGSTAPNPTYPYQWWADTSTGILKQRNAANTAWIDVLSLTTGLPVGVIPIANGGTGATTAAAARTALGAGAANGLATLDSSTKVPIAQLYTAVANGLATLDSTMRVPAAQLGTGTADATTFLRGDRTWVTAPYPIGSICQVATVQTRTQATYSAPTTGNGTEITPLNTSITPRKSGNIMILEWQVSGEVHHNTVFLVARNGSLLPNTTDASNNRWAGTVTALHDYDNNSSPSVYVVRIVDYSTLATASTYSLLIRSSDSNAYIFYLNRTITSSGADIYETGLSTATAMEIMV